MLKKKTDFAIINRSFWPSNQVIGEALLCFAEQAAKMQSVSVVTQSHEDLQQAMDDIGRGGGVDVRACKAHTNSSSGLIKRCLDAIYFMLWTLICLIKLRPAKVYIATDPPVIVPFIVCLYCWLFRAKFYYHLQDIHPEAANIAVSLNHYLFNVLRRVDNFTMRKATLLITLSEDMRQFIQQRSGTTRSIHLLDNPAFRVDAHSLGDRPKDIVFCGNAGRLQRIPLLLIAIRTYLKCGGMLNFTFVGAGIYATQIEELADEYEQVMYLGYLPAAQAADTVNHHRWALLPIEDEVTCYAFPSKSSSYVRSGCGILAICGEKTGVARWVREERVGISCEPNHDALVSCLQSLEGMDDINFSADDSLLTRLEIGYFVDRLLNICDLTS